MGRCLSACLPLFTSAIPHTLYTRMHYDICYFVHRVNYICTTSRELCMHSRNQ